MRAKVLKIYTICMGAGLLYYLLGKVTGFYFPCLYYAEFGIQCPGCGATKMFLSLAKLDFISAFAHNPALFIIFFYWNVVALLCFIGKPHFVQKPQFLYTSLGVSIALFLILGFARNIY